MANHVQIVSANVGALSNATRAIFKVPSGYGGIRIVDARYIDGGAGTSWLQLADLGTAGTAAGTIIAAGGTVTHVANVPNTLALTAANCYVAEGHYVGVVEKNVGALNTVSIVEVAYLPGK